MTTLDDAAERRIAQLVGDFYDGQRTMESAVDAAWREGAESATEAAAKKCEAYSAALNDKDPHAYAMSAAALYCAAAIRGKGG